MTTGPLIQKLSGFLILALLLSGCGVPAVLREAGEVANPAVSGELSVRGAQGESVLWRPDRCLSGEHEQFFGFILGAEGSPIVLRAVIDPLDGPGLRVMGLDRPEGVVFRPEACERMELDVEPTGWEVNEFQDLNGRLDVRCSITDVGSIEGSVAVRHCH